MHIYFKFRLLPDCFCSFRKNTHTWTLRSNSWMILTMTQANTQLPLYICELLWCLRASWAAHRPVRRIWTWSSPERDAHSTAEQNRRETVCASHRDTFFSHHKFYVVQPGCVSSNYKMKTLKESSSWNPHSILLPSKDIYAQVHSTSFRVFELLLQILQSTEDFWV